MADIDPESVRSNALSKTQALLSSIDENLAMQLFGTSYKDDLSDEIQKVVRIQAFIRGYLARKRFLLLLLEKYDKEEETRKKIEDDRVIEGEMLLQSMQAVQRLSDRHYIERQREFQKTQAASLIQQRFREWLHKRKILQGLVEIDESDSSFTEETVHHQSESTHSSLFDASTLAIQAMKLKDIIDEESAKLVRELERRDSLSQECEALRLTIQQLIAQIEGNKDIIF